MKSITEELIRRLLFDPTKVMRLPINVNYAGDPKLKALCPGCKRHNNYWIEDPLRLAGT